MYNDDSFDTNRSDHQQKNFRTFLDLIVKQKKKFVIIEVGANKEIPTLRSLAENILSTSENST